MSSIQASCGIVFGSVFIPFEVNLREYSSFICLWICSCENFTGALSSYAPNALATSSGFRPVCLSPLSDRKSLSDETVPPRKSSYWRTSSACRGIKNHVNTKFKKYFRETFQYDFPSHEIPHAQVNHLEFMHGRAVTPVVLHPPAKWRR